MKVAAIQHDIIWEDPEANFGRLAPMIANAAAGGAGLVVLTEMYSTGFSMDSSRIAEREDGPSTEFLLKQAGSNGIWVCGSVPERPAGQELPYNRLLLAAPDGVVHRYAKIHPFSYAREHERYAAGGEPLTVSVGGVRVSFFVCYDLRFADEFWPLATTTDSYVIVANWPESRAAHWRALLVARAIENQAYVVGCNRVGEGGGLAYAGDSMIVDPLGKILVTATGCETSLLADVDPIVVSDVRKRFPFLADRRP